MAYPNGRVPLNALVHLGGLIYLPPGTAARWRWLVKEGKRRFGVTFTITGPGRYGWDGWNGYRPYDIQVKYKDAFGNMAASPGTSSHGGTYRGQGDVFAIDVANWGAVRWADFAQLCAEAGFRVNFVTPVERWHIGDFNNPWVIPPFAAEKPEPAPVPITPKDEEMIVIRIDTGASGKHMAMLGLGTFSHLTQGDRPEIMADITGQERIFDFGISHLPRLLRSYGCDRDIWDVRGGKFVVLDPMKAGKADHVAEGNTWTAEKQVRADMAALVLALPKP